ncbi:hypothetical protein Desaci_0862 [Desulfosporosinus acidiphilus SJ4]|uniref:Lipoprotein n=1 Tax=Desulfosporosinus acidiphilus (strain DSM 22704 / JCM 16185 / SJ4) TaxID=646529 RepID=I4D293_DESAJ|nr:hypothetical protein [Desulfosporosinus acidiphilus]AFM39917.1 hypothetical protein Desaci_0862 [Desulfosporosinus acidiphilus SJ4]
MQKLFQFKKALKKPSLITGALLLAALIGVSGCGSSTAASASSTTQAQSSSQGQTKQGQSAQGQRTLNPAQQAAMEIRRLENNQQNPLTSDQKDKLKPILQALISTSNPSQDFLQQKADAINAVFTDQQKSYLATPPQRPSNGTNQNANNKSSNQNSQNANNANGSNTQRRSGQNRGTFNPQQFYQQVLDSLTK